MVPVPFSRKRKAFPEILGRLTEILPTRELHQRLPKLQEAGKVLGWYIDAQNQIVDL